MISFLLLSNLYLVSLSTLYLISCSIFICVILSCIYISDDDDDDDDDDDQDYCWDEMYYASSQHSPISSPSYPDAYPNSADCSTTIYAAGGQVVELSFNQFDLEYDSGCDDYDWIEVHYNMLWEYL